MIATLLWKEYREQRALWIDIAVLTVLLALILAATLGAGNLTFQGDSVRLPLVLVVYTLAIAHGVVCGALLLAGDREAHTLSFLDAHASRRWELWKTKAVAGLGLCLAQGLFFALFTLILGFARWDVAAWLPFASFDALVWGMVGGALGANVLVSVFAAIAFAAGSWLAPLVAGAAGAPVMILLKLGLATLGVYTSALRYCGPDLSRPAALRGPPPRRV